MKLGLVVLTEGKWKGKEINVPVSQFLIGRDPQCHMRPSNPLISKRHCAVVTRGEQVYVLDYESTNGTFVNQRQVKGEIELKDGDSLRVGPLEFRVRIETGVPIDRRTPLPANKTSAPDDDEAAALLLSTQDGDDASQGTVQMDKDGVPIGSTIHDRLAVPDTQQDLPDAAQASESAEKSKLEKAKQAAADTSAAASAILTKYLRRPRSVG
jgi:pSer/pThr/pTyr-binding forkhead associated (FHA) protein